MEDTGQNNNFEKLLTFPVDYEFKIIGKADELFIEDIVRRIESILKRNLDRGTTTKRESSKKKYISYSVRVYLEKYDELKEIYQFLKSQESISYYL